MKFSDFAELSAKSLSPKMSEVQQILDCSLEIYTRVGMLAESYRMEMRGAKITRDLIVCEIRDALLPITKLFCLANQGNQIDDTSIEGYFLWNGAGSGGFTIEAIMQLCHLASQNLRNISSGVLERSGFYPLYPALARVAAGYETTLAEVSG
jgi:hypothetical protein